MDADDDAAPSARAARKRRQRQSIGSSACDSQQDEEMLDAMLEELGIPSRPETTPKSKTPRAIQVHEQVIELITPPRARRRVLDDADAANGDGDAEGASDMSMLDLTTPTPPPSKRQSIVDLISPDRSESSQQQSQQTPSPVLLPLAQRLRAAIAMQDHNEDEDAGSNEIEASIRADPPSQHALELPATPAANRQATDVRRAVRPEQEQDRRRIAGARASPSRPQQRERSSAAQPALAASSRSSPCMLVALERELAVSDVGRAIETALRENVYNNKTVPCQLVEPPFAAEWRLLLWYRQDPRPRADAADGFAVAMYLEANALLQLLDDRQYPAMLERVQRMQKTRPRFDAVTNSKFKTWTHKHIIIQGADQALIARTQQQQHQRSKRKLTYADLHELAFQLFMDTGTHTSFSCDAAATAEQVAMLTREMLAAGDKQSLAEAFLEGVPRGHSFRVMPRSASTMNAYGNAWLRMLQVIPGVSEDKAQRILDAFPTLQSLLQVYNDPSRSLADKEDLLSDKMVPSRLERALSKRIFVALTTRDADAAA